jgi:hypothetical protein
MTRFRSLSVVVLAVVPAVCAATDDTLDPSKIKDKVKIKIGEKLIVRFERKGDALSDPKTVKQSTADPPTPVFDFNKLDESLALTTKNPFPKDLKFRAIARLKGQKDYFETSIVPVKSGLFSVELWQDPIEELVLFEFKLVDEK